MAVDQCPLCHRNYAQLSQHLRVTHKVTNVTERKLLLALESGRVNVRVGVCPVPGCYRESNRLDRHLKSHTELSAAVRRNAMAACKRKKILQDLAKLRASNPEVQMASSLDLDEPDSVGEKEVPAEEEEEEEVCENRGCKTKVSRLVEENADLRNQVETLASTLREVSRRYRSLKRQRGKKLSDQVKRVTKQLLLSFQREDEDEDAVPPTPPTEGTSSSQPTSSAVLSPQLHSSQRSSTPQRSSTSQRARSDMLERAAQRVQEAPGGSRTNS
ncbi:uncharacterized protein [Misgurnus anguillicaudatus]|uniref:uncharacterized protein isoform X2 n=1 Tax=Misgurnus anguillicaudatus TaxID=75329 RepID=UPI003CCF0B1B